MGDRLKKITQSITRIFKRGGVTRARKKLTTTRIICPEKLERLKKEPLNPVRRAPGTLLIETELVEVSRLPGGVIHVRFKLARFTVKVIKVRDPITARYSRRQVNKGIKKIKCYYDKSGVLLDDSRADW